MSRRVLTHQAVIFLHGSHEPKHDKSEAGEREEQLPKAGDDSATHERAEARGGELIHQQTISRRGRTKCFCGGK